MWHMVIGCWFTQGLSGKARELVPWAINTSIGGRLSEPAARDLSWHLEPMSRVFPAGMGWHKISPYGTPIASSMVDLAGTVYDAKNGGSHYSREENNSARERDHGKCGNEPLTSWWRKEDWERERGLVEACYSSFSCLDHAMGCVVGVIIMLNKCSPHLC